jgi:rod shape-determining protein MreD
MRWLPFFILAYVVLGVQVGLSGYDQIYRGRPNFALLAVVFIAVNAHRDAALLGCFLLGLMQDLLTQVPLGLNALAYGVVGILVIALQEVVYREHFLTHLVLGLAGGLVYAAVVYLHGVIYTAMRGPRAFSRPSLAPLLAGAIYTAALAPFVLYLLVRMKRLFGFRPVRSHAARRGL